MTAIDDLLDTLPPTSSLLALLDFDGTLSAIVRVPDEAVPWEGAEEALARLGSRCEVAVISGRPVQDLRKRLSVGPTVTLAGGHGTEVVHPDGVVDALVDPAEVRDTLEAVERELHEVVDLSIGWLIERKPASIAVHHRMVADPGTTLLAVRRVLDAHVDDPPGFRVADGKAVTELRPAGVDKGTVVDQLAERHRDRHVLVVGDDLTDEDAFRVANERHGTTVLVAGEPRETTARFRIGGPAEVVELLSRLADRA